MGEAGDGDPVRSTDRTGESDATDGADRSTATATGGPRHRPAQAPPGEGSFGWRGWVLVAMIVLSFLVIPWTLVYLPAARGPLAELGLSLRDAYLALPMIPAILLAAVAVWAAVRSRAR